MPVADGVVSRAKDITYLSELLSFFFPLCMILILLDGAEEEVNLSDNNFGKRI